MLGQFQNLPGIRPILQDGNLQFENLSNAPKVLVIGTAEQGLNYQPVLVRKLLDAKAEFGAGGTLLRGGYEVKAQRAENLVMMRIGGSAAIVEGIGVAGATGGYKITTELLDDAAGGLYAVFYDVATDHLAIYNTDTGEWVYDNVNDINNGEVCVEKLSVITGGEDIGSQSSPVLMSALGTAPYINYTYTAGTDGLNLSRMEMYEALYNAYQRLAYYDFDFIVPMDVYIDDLNVADLSASEIATLGLGSLTTYPTADSSTDALGEVYVQEYQGTNYFWWDMDGDGVAEIYPSVGLAGPAMNIDGEALTTASFHPTNFAYQLANFCYDATYDFRFVQGFISFKLPDSLCTADIANWIGKLPTYTTDPVTGVITIASASDNGTGMLGDKFMAGRSDYRGGVQNGGFIATDSGWIDGTELEDDNEHVVDIGKYLSILGMVLVHSNNYTTSAYISTGATAYAGLASTLAPDSAPTNKAMRAVRLQKLIKSHFLDRLTGVRIITAGAKPKGTVVMDSPTAARPDSDYTRFTTVRIVKASVDLLREVADPFIGEGGSEGNRAAMQTAIEDKFNEQLVPNALKRYDIQITATPAQFASGQAIVELVLVPQFELRYLFVNISLSAQ